MISRSHTPRSRRHQWLLANNPIIFSVEREWVETGDISRVLETLESMQQSHLLIVARNSITCITQPGMLPVVQRREYLFSDERRP
jgi:hypothetical protein